ncbi:MAG: Maf family protein [Sphingomonadales bacterium]|nr:septum formation protein Maf [Sphingomonadales bacterium]
MQKIILASQSPRRKQLLEWAAVPFDIRVPDTLEDFPPNTALCDIPVHIARQKALAIQPQVPETSIVLAADTVVVLGEQVIGKPVHREEAVSMLWALSGQVHRVITGVVLRKGNEEISFYDSTEVAFHPLTLEQIEYYVDQYKPYDKAGAYAIQEWIGVVGIRYINGDFYNVMGLPVSRVLQALREW